MSEVRYVAVGRLALPQDAVQCRSVVTASDSVRGAAGPHEPQVPSCRTFTHDRVAHPRETSLMADSPNRAAIEAECTAAEE